MRERSPGDIVLFSWLRGENEAMDEHVARNGIAARIAGDTFVIAAAAAHSHRPGYVPLMLGGAARFQRGNISPPSQRRTCKGGYDDIRAGLLSSPRRR